MASPLTRRDFISDSALLAAGTAASVLAAAPARAAANERIGLGLIGCGGIMAHHVRGLVERNSAVDFVHLCDVDSSQIARADIGGKRP